MLKNVASLCTVGLRSCAESDVYMYRCIIYIYSICSGVVLYCLSSSMIFVSVVAYVSLFVYTFLDSYPLLVSLASRSCVSRYLSFTLSNRYAQPSGLFQALLVWQIVFVDGPIGKTNKQPIPKYSWSSGKHRKPIENNCLGNRFLLKVWPYIHCRLCTVWPTWMYLTIFLDSSKSVLLRTGDKSCHQSHHFEHVTFAFWVVKLG